MPSQTLNPVSREIIKATRTVTAGLISKYTLSPIIGKFVMGTMMSDPELGTMFAIGMAAAMAIYGVTAKPCAKVTVALSEKYVGFHPLFLLKSGLYLSSLILQTGLAFSGFLLARVIMDPAGTIASSAMSAEFLLPITFLMVGLNVITDALLKHPVGNPFTKFSVSAGIVLLTCFMSMTETGDAHAFLSGLMCMFTATGTGVIIESVQSAIKPPEDDKQQEVSTPLRDNEARISNVSNDYQTLEMGAGNT